MSEIPKTIAVGDIYVDIILETFHDNEAKRTRIRPVDSRLFNMRVEFPKSAREAYPLGTRFSAQVKVAQKTNKFNSSPVGRPYLVASPKSIKLAKTS